MKLALWNIQFSYIQGKPAWRRNGSVDVLAPTLQRALAVVESRSEVWPELAVHVAQKRTAGSEILWDPAIIITDGMAAEVDTSPHSQSAAQSLEAAS